MNLPGFSAESSLYQTSKRYRMIATVTQADGAIQAAIFPRPNCFVSCLDDQCVGYDDPYCYDNCRCICYGRPGVTCWLR
jgi:hypothetical protein